MSKSKTIPDPKYIRAPKGVCTTCYAHGFGTKCGFPCKSTYAFAKELGTETLERTYYGTLWSLQAACV